MKAKRLSLAIVALLAAVGLWLARSNKRAHEIHEAESAAAGAESGNVADFMAPNGPPKPGRPPQPPNPTRRFNDFTPEKRVEFARKGHGPGG